MKKEPEIIDMERHGNVFVPAKRKAARIRKPAVSRFAQPGPSRRFSQPQQIGKILEGMVTDFFKIVRKEMFR